RLGQGDTFGEMALLSGGQRTATARSLGETDLLAIEKRDFDQLIANDPRLAEAVERLSHQRAITNLGAGGPQAATRAEGDAARPPRGGGGRAGDGTTSADPRQTGYSRKPAPGPAPGSRSSSAISSIR